MSTAIQDTGEVREYLHHTCDTRGISGYSLEQGIWDKGWSNASGSRAFISGRQDNITLDTFFTICQFLKLRVTIEPAGGGKKKTGDRKHWDWQGHKPAYQRLVQRGDT